MSTFLRIIRIKNLIFIALIQYLMGQAVITPILQSFGFESALEPTMLWILILATVFIAAGGYILNDYFDIKIDSINKPEKLIVGNTISRGRAMLMHQILTGIGVLAGLFLAFYSQSYTIGFIFIVVPGLLWFYSASYKRQFLIGNLVTAFLAALSILVVGILQLAFLQKEYDSLVFETPIPNTIYSWIGGFSFFSFIFTWIREIIKDIEDEGGDREMECRTMPIVWGIFKTKLFLYTLIILTIGGLFIINELYIPFEGSLTLRYIIVGILLPNLVLIYLLFTAKNKVDFHQISSLCKAIMASGVLYSLIFYYLQAKTYGISLFNLFIVK